MQKLRSTFKRSRTPTGAEMKSQSSLEVPKQIRSASFDEIQLQTKRQDDRTTSSSSSTCSPARSQDSMRGRRGSATLKVPQHLTGQRSKSFDAYSASSASSPSTQLPAGGIERPETPIIQVSGCYHCACVEEYRSLWLTEDVSRDEAADVGDPASADSTDLSENESDREDEQESKREGSPEIRVTYVPPEVTEEASADPDSEVRSEFPERQRRLSRQEALTTFPLEHLPALASAATASEADDDDDDEENENVEPCGSSKFVVRDIFLTVPELKRDRAASVDSCFNNNKNGSATDADSLAVPQQSIRSKSVDIVLPTDARTRYTALLPGKESRPSIGGREDSGEDSRDGGGSSGHREPRSTPDWGPNAFNGEHLWVPTATSGDFCYVNDCSKHGPRLKCPACRVVAHALCVGSLEFACKPSFRDVGVRQYREQTTIHHHWVHRRSQKGKCANCGKSFQSKLSFSSREIVAVSCSWCKAAYHNRESCFNVEKIGENCELGTHASIIVPPSWIVKLPRKGSFRSSLRRSPRRKKSDGSSYRRKSKEKEKEEKEKDKEKEKSQEELWVVKPIPTATVKPVLVFINPKSGGNQGAKLLQKFQWLLNPRQVFDLTQGGPKMGLELFKKVPNLRVLACGGDGTVGWVLSILDQIGVYPAPAVGVLPLGTGNDLARALGWGGGYKDEPIGKILTSISDSETTLLDRWQLKVERNPDAKNDDDGGKGKENLPLNVVNNYFSLGVDAHIALEFHEAREAHPEKFNSRMRNKLFYGQMGCKDLLLTKWKDLSDFVTLECDGQDMTPKLREHRVHAILFLNIASYGGGTHPWSAGSGTREPAMDDGLIEVVGLTTYQLPLLQARGHGTCIVQCSTAKLVTTKTIPMQVDGEACRLLPSIITLSMLNKATMLAKRRNAGKPSHHPARLDRLRLPVMKIKMSDYEAYHHNKEKLQEMAESWLAEPLDLDATTDLESLRKLLSKDYNIDSCCFLDSCTAERFFRIDRGQEQLHYVTDVAVDAVYVLDEDSVQQQSDGQAGPSQTVASRESETAHIRLPSDERLKEMPVVTGKANRSNEDRGGQEQTSVVGKIKLFRRRESVSFDKESEGQNGVRPKDLASRRCSLNIPSENKSSESNSRVRRESLKNSHVAIARAEQSQQADRSLAFISPRDRLFGLNSGVHGFTAELLEKNCDEILRAAKIGDLPTLKQLHQKGYSLLSIDETGQTALHLASRHGYKDIVRYLIGCAPPTILNMIDNDKGQTALHKAAQNKRRSICCMLVAGGASLMVKDRHGNTPHHLALIAEDHDLAAYLQSQEHFQLATDEMESDL
ncbi:eye-specific diacylglycerol kinase isoform X2 [Solenopsis invicta]|uniref:eye-specific diacylglycerol kinase isoform X2 n=1 Tax=Solenopsis invicta TaxID=13686 RepID=UPI000595D297|nr:eye-specific diacylglycerol kinase isoform X2 [Solenopsis invicta]